MPFKRNRVFTTESMITIDTGTYVPDITDIIKSMSDLGDCMKMPRIRNVIFNPPATVVLWTDGTKTVVKCGERDAYDHEKGFAMAIAKKVMGNKGNYFKTFKKWVKYEECGCGPDYCEIGGETND